MHPNSLYLILFWLIKIGLLIVDLLFVGFGVLLVRQIRLMAETIKDPLNKSLILVGWGYLFLTILTFFFLFFYLKF